MNSKESLTLQHVMAAFLGSVETLFNETGNMHVKYKIKYNRHCDQIHIFTVKFLMQVIFSVQLRKSYLDNISSLNVVILQHVHKSYCSHYRIQLSP